MIQSYTRLKVADNTGARQVMCIGLLGSTGRKYARVGDIIVGSVKRATLHGNPEKLPTLSLHLFKQIWKAGPSWAHRARTISNNALAARRKSLAVLTSNTGVQHRREELLGSEHFTRSRIFGCTSS